MSSEDVHRQIAKNRESALAKLAAKRKLNEERGNVDPLLEDHFTRRRVRAIHNDGVEPKSVSLPSAVSQPSASSQVPCATQTCSSPVSKVSSDSQTKKRLSVDFYTDGNCKGNPGPGGWAVLAVFTVDEVGPEKTRRFMTQMSGFEGMTTNNKMELMGAINALKLLEPASCPVSDAHITSVRHFLDSTYVKNGITEWIKTWKRNSWKTANRQPVKNQELWMALDSALTVFPDVEFRWVRGHSDTAGNNRADALANDAIARRAGMVEHDLPVDLDV